MNRYPPDFFMVSTEWSEPYAPKKCWRIKRLRGHQRDDLLLVRVEPPFDVLDIHTEKVLIATRLAGTSLFPISRWPLPVYVDAVKIDDIESHDIVNPGDTTQIDWAALLPTEEEARKYNLPPERDTR